MSRQTHWWTVWSLLVIVALAWGHVGATAQSSAPSAAPLVADGADALTLFGERMVGRWEAPDSRHVFEWGVGRRVIKSTSYFPEGDSWTLVSEGMWFRDPSTGSVRGTVVAIGMPIELMEYTTRLEGDVVVHDLVTQGEMGGTFVERWHLSGDTYRWSLEQDGAVIMGGEYRRMR